MKKENKTEAAARLRERSEELLKKKSVKSVSKLSETETLKLIHELEVHQIELQLQNEELKLAKEQEKVASEKIIELYDFAPSGYFALSKEGKIKEVNLSGAKMLGHERSLLKNNLFHFFVSEDKRDVFKDFFQKVFESKTKESCEVTLSTDDNLPMHIYITGIVTENGEQCFVIAIDITEKKRAEEEINMLANALKSINECVSITDTNDNIIFVNQAFLRNYGYAKEEIIGKNIEILGSENNPEDIHKKIQSLSQKGLWQGELINKRKDGTEFPIYLSTTSVFDNKGKSTAFIGVAIDITERKRAENELLIAKQKAEESDRLKSAFLANMSHEIRTPMNGILGFAGLLKEPKLTGEEQKKYIRMIEKSGVRMLNIINDIIDISKIESGQMEVSISEININEKIEYIYTFFKPEIEGKGMQINFNNTLPSKESVIKTDREKIYSILTNLVKNAIKYTNEGSIEFGYTLKGKYIEFYVKDTGIGIPKDRQTAIFERFIQADISDIRALQGAGLGLAIAKAYTEMLGGKIWVESEEGKGSMFYFTIPYNTAEKNEIKNVVLEEDEAKELFVKMKKLKILIAEDVGPSDMLITIAINKIDKDICHEVLHVKTGVEAVETCRNNPDIDLVLMDIKMPEMDGYEATRQIRQFNKNVIIIAQTAHGLTGDRKKAITAGCNEYIAKPFNKNELRLIIEKCLGR